MTPAHAITVWLTDDQIMVAYLDGQLIPIPADPQRLITILRAQEARARPVKKLLVYPTTYPLSPRPVEDNKAAKRAEKLEAEKRARMKRIEKRDRAAADNELLNMLGL